MMAYDYMTEAKLLAEHRPSYGYIVQCLMAAHQRGLDEGEHRGIARALRHALTIAVSERKRCEDKSRGDAATVDRIAERIEKLIAAAERDGSGE